MHTKSQPLTYQQLIDAIAALPPYVPPSQIYYTPFATKEETVTRTWKERLFTLPWRPLQRDKIQSQPTIYAATIPILSIRPGLSTPPRHRPIFIVHPSFKNTIEKALSAEQQAGLKDQSQ